MKNASLEPAQTGALERSAGPRRVGFLGCGQIARMMHAPALMAPALSPLFRLTTVYDPSGKAVRALEKDLRRAGYPAPAVAPSAEALVGSADVDAVAILSPTSTHRDLLEQTIRAGKPTLVEKPICRTSAEAWALADQAAVSGVPVQVGMVLRHSRTIDQIDALQASGRLGRLLWMQWDELRPYAPTRWRYRSESEGDVLLWDKAVHQIDLFRHVARSPITRVSGKGSQLLLPRDGEPPRELRSFNYRVALSGEGYDHVALILEHASGVTSLLHISYVSPWGRESRWILQFEEGKVLVYWEHPIQPRGSATFTYLLTDDPGRAHSLHAPWRVPPAYPPSADGCVLVEESKDPLHHGSIAQWQHFAEVVERKVPPRCTLEEAAMTIAVAEAASSAIENGVTVDVRVPDRTVAPSPPVPCSTASHLEPRA